jgi:predicted dehydrogenase
MPLGFGLIGSGFMGKAHTLGFLNVNRVFRLPVEVALRKLADVDAATAERGAKDLGFPSFTGDWRELVSDPSIDIVSVATPNVTHREMSLAAIAHGKHVYCEKPLAPTAAEAGEMALAAEKADVKSMVGFNYSRNPLFGLAKDIIASGEIGEVRMIRAIHAEDHMRDADAPWTWRIDPAGGGGALIDIGSHILATTLYLLGPIVRVLGDVATLIQARPVARGAKERRKVEVDDVSRAFVRFASGVQGVIEATYVSTGRKMQHEFEISGSKGAISFSQERFNEIDLFVASDASGRRGFRKIFAGPEHKPYGDFCIVAGHQLGFNDLKIIEVRDLLLAIAGNAPVFGNFRDGWQVQKTVEAIYRSSAERRWVDVD